MANVEFGTGKTVLILTIVVACFAVLWPKIFYPMLMSSTTAGKPQSDSGNGCCDVLFETDVNAIEIMSEMCTSIFKRHKDLDAKLASAIQEGKFSKDAVRVCRSEVMNICGIDIAEFLNEKVRLGHSYKQILDEIRSYNASVCLRQNFGVSPGSLGTPRRMPKWGPVTSRHLRQERPLHLRPEMMHPALRERGRAIPQSNLPPSVPLEKDGGIRPPPIPGMRPPMGGPGHVVPPPKVGSTMSIVMPLYTIGIVVFSVYTIMKVFIRKTGSSDNYKDFNSDPEFRRVVFADDYSNGSSVGPTKDEGASQRTISKREAPSTIWKSPSDDGTRLVMTAITGLLAEVDQQLSRDQGDTQTQYSTDLKEDKKIPEDICTEEVKLGGKRDAIKSEQVDKVETTSLSESCDGLHEPVGSEFEGDDSKPKVKVMGVETVAECEGGLRWSGRTSPDLGVVGPQNRIQQQQHHHHRRTPPLLDSPEPQNIFLEGSLPSQSQLLVTDSKTQALTLPPAEDGPEPPVILSGTMTLSLISLDPALPQDAHSHSGNVQDVASQRQRKVTADDDERKVVEVKEKLDDVDDEDEEAGTHYTTATMSEGAEAGSVAEPEDTGADLSNMDEPEGDDEPEEIRDEDNVWSGEDRETRTK